ncbi:MAG: helix-turn-helix domain-containing protein, partial [Alphaproteobacteria bacterium]
MDIGDKIAAARNRKGWSQARLAQALGQAQTTVSSWERGRTEPTRSDVARLSEVLGMPNLDAMPSVAAGPGEIEDLIHERLFSFPGQHFLSVHDLTRPDAEALIDLSDAFVALSRQRAKHSDLLAGRTLVN